MNGLGNQELAQVSSAHLDDNHEIFGVDWPDAMTVQFEKGEERVTERAGEKPVKILSSHGSVHGMIDDTDRPRPRWAPR